MSCTTEHTSTKTEVISSLLLQDYLWESIAPTPVSDSSLAR